MYINLGSYIFREPQKGTTVETRAECDPQPVPVRSTVPRLGASGGIEFRGPGLKTAFGLWDNRVL